MTRVRSHAPEPGSGVVTRTACGRDLNPSAGSYGSHSSVPTLSSMPTCKACKAARASWYRKEAALARVAEGAHPTGNGYWRMPS